MTPIQQSIITYIDENPGADLLDIKSGVPYSFDQVMDAMIGLKQEGIIARRYVGPRGFDEVSTRPVTGSTQKS